MRSTSAWTYVQRLSPKSVRQIKIRVPDGGDSVSTRFNTKALDEQGTSAIGRFKRVKVTHVRKRGRGSVLN